MGFVKLLDLFLHAPLGNKLAGRATAAERQADVLLQLTQGLGGAKARRIHRQTPHSQRQPANGSKSMNLRERILLVIVLLIAAGAIALTTSGAVLGVSVRPYVTISVYVIAEAFVVGALLALAYAAGLDAIIATLKHAFLNILTAAKRARDKCKRAVAAARGL